MFPIVCRLPQTATTSRFSRIAPSSSKPNFGKGKPNFDAKKLKKEGDYDLEASPKSVLSTFIPKIQNSIFGGRSQAPMNWNYPNKRLDDDFKIEGTLKEVVEIAPDLTRGEIKKLKKEIGELMDNPLDKPDYLAYTQGLKHGEAMIEYEFKTDEDMKKWQTGCDSDRKQGYSTVELIHSPRNTAIFKGFLNTEVIKDGKTTRAGWASMKTMDKLAFDRKKKFWKWGRYSHLMIKCRGDGRSYKIMLYVPGAIDLTWGDMYSYPLHTHGGPYWQYEKIPFSRFFHTVGGRIQDNQKRICEREISSIGIGLMDRMDGEFQLEIDYIGCYHDASHEEYFAYETYSIPMFNPQTI
uniref:NADH:ubiquinone oxidoreductase intermediate-associated protein 30 domain-containing protein n=1 Tax=Panagrolaimus sp. JU765 TaxID=591449 RepID=A0AC34PW12_9BILA